MAFFDHYSDSRPTPVGNWLNRLTAQTEYQLIVSHAKLATGAPILEIGPGRGYLARHFVSAGFPNYHAIEPNPKLAKQASTIPVQVISTKTVPPLKTKPASYQLIIASNLLEHLPLGQAITLLTHVRPALKRSGYLALIGPDYLDWRQDFHHTDYSHQFPTTLRNLELLLHDLGFSLKFHTYLHGPFTNPIGHLTNLFLKSLLCWAGPYPKYHRFYKLKLAFLRRYFIIAQKQP